MSGLMPEGSPARYRTIVADPPWRYDEGWPINWSPTKRRNCLPYPSLDAAAIGRLPVGELANATGCHLYLWTTNRYLRDAFSVVDSWGFRYAQTLVWAKKPQGIGPGGTFANNAEFVIFARKGVLPHIRRVDTVWWNWPRTHRHSRKPEHFIDLVEQVSPGPYLELFSRRHRLGWDVWGLDVESSIEMAAD